MLEYLVLYDSESGNTKKIAAAIFSRLPGNSKDLIDINTDKTIPEARVYFIGFCVHRGTCSLRVSDFLGDLSGKAIALFGTCGMGDSPEYYKRIEQSVSAWINTWAPSSARAGCPRRCGRNTRPCAMKKTRNRWIISSAISTRRCPIPTAWMKSTPAYS